MTCTGKNVCVVLLFGSQIRSLRMSFSVQMRDRMRLSLGFVLEHVPLSSFTVIVVTLRNDCSSGVPIAVVTTKETTQS